MSKEEFKINEKYRSRVNNVATQCEYEIIKKNKTTCWVRLWEEGKPTEVIYKNVRYNILRK